LYYTSLRSLNFVVLQYIQFLIIIQTVCCAGRGVFLLEARNKHSFLIQYAGELIDAEEGYRREDKEDDDSVFRYYMQYKKKKLW